MPEANRQIFYDEQQGKFQRMGLKKFKKDLIRDGRWVHPDTGKEIVVTPERMDHWIKQFNAMAEAGLKVYMPIDHKANDSTKNAGFGEALFRDGNTLYAILDVPDSEYAEKIGSTIQEVSISVTPEWTDGKEKKWKDFIDHISPCTYGVIEGQGNFEELPIAARIQHLCAGGEAVFLRAKETDDMDKLKTLLATLFGIKPDAEDFDAQVETSVTKLKADLDAAEKAVMRKGGDEDKDKEITKLRQQVVDLKAKVPAEKHEPTPEELALRRSIHDLDVRLMAGEIEAYTNDGKLSPAMAESAAVKSLLMARGVMLSADGEEKSVKDLFAEFMNSLPSDCIVELGERKRKQNLRDAKGANDGKPPASPNDEKAKEIARENLRLAGEDRKGDE